MPVAGSAHSLGVEIHRTCAKRFGHLDTAQVSLPGVAPAWGLVASKALDCGVKSILASTRQELLDQRLKPAGSVAPKVMLGIVRVVEGGIPGAQQCQAPVSGRFRLGKGKESLRQGTVGDPHFRSHLRR